MANLQKIPLKDGRVISGINMIDKIKMVSVPLEFENHKAVVEFSFN